MTPASNSRVRRPTRNDVAKRANVSGWTVSNVLNGQSNASISAQTRKQVMEAAECLGYQPNNSARALATGRTRTIGVWMCLGYSRYRAHALHRLRRLTKDSRFEIVVRDIEEEISREGKLANAFKIPLDGIVAFDTPTVGNRVVQSQAGQPVPLVSMGAFWVEDRDFVGVDLYAGTVDAMKHLLEAGRRNITYLLPKPEEEHYSEARTRAYIDLMKDAGLEPHFLYAPDLSLATSHQTVTEHVGAGASVDAILCHDDGMAFGAHRALLDLGVKIGADVALIGCDGIEETEYLSPPLTTIVQPIDEMCATAWSFLEKRIENPTGDLQQIVLKPKLVIRASSESIVKIR